MITKSFVVRENTTKEYIINDGTIVIITDGWRSTYMFGVCSGTRNAFQVLLNTMDSGFLPPTYSWPSKVFKLTAPMYDTTIAFLQP